MLQRTALAHAMLLTLRGVPVIYAGDEQGFVGRGGDQSARQTLFPSQVAEYNQDIVLGTDATSADANFDTHHPLFQLIARLSALRGEHSALRHGQQRVRAFQRSPGIFAVSRFDPVDNREYLIAFNTSTQPLAAQVTVEATSTAFSALQGECAATPTAAGSLRVSLPPLGFVICAGASP